MNQVIAEDVHSHIQQSANVTIRLTDKNDHAPVFIEPEFTASVLENATGDTEVLRVQVCSRLHCGRWF